MSTISADMRKLKSDPNPLDKEAIDLFIYCFIRQSGAIGEHDSSLRSQVCKKLSWLEVELDEDQNCQAT